MKKPAGYPLPWYHLVDEILEGAGDHDSVPPRHARAPLPLTPGAVSVKTFAVKHVAAALYGQNTKKLNGNNFRAC